MTIDTAQPSGEISAEKRLRDARKFLRLRQQTVADYLGMKRQSYAAIEKGTRNLMALEMARLCNLYRLTPNELLGFSDYGV
jgi:transcriptional regulator with XRE-family HTH domain